MQIDKELDHTLALDVVVEQVKVQPGRLATALTAMPLMANQRCHAAGTGVFALQAVSASWSG